MIAIYAFSVSVNIIACWRSYKSNAGEGRLALSRYSEGLHAQLNSPSPSV
jgi:hypothetical protein